MVNIWDIVWLKNWSLELRCPGESTYCTCTEARFCLYLRLPRKIQHKHSTQHSTYSSIMLSVVEHFDLLRSLPDALSVGCFFDVLLILGTFLVFSSSLCRRSCSFLVSKLNRSSILKHFFWNCLDKTYGQNFANAT